MAEITPAKNNILTEETDFKSAVSEQLFQKIGGSINFINNKQFMVFDFRFLGPFHPIASGEDSALPLPFNIEITAISFRLRDCGTSGNTTVDLHKIDSSGADSGSILTNKIVVDSNDSNSKGFFVNFIESTNNNVSNVGSQLPTMSDANRNVDAGESIRVDIDSNATGARDLAVYVFYRPR